MRHNNIRAILRGILAAAGLLGVASAGAFAAPPKPLARPGEVVMKVPVGTSSATLDQLLARAGFEMIKPVAYTPDTYLVGLKGRRTDVVSEEPTAELKQAILKLKQTTGVLADPNYLRFIKGWGGNGRASAPPGTPLPPDDKLFGQQWGMTMIRMPEAWKIQYGRNQVIVGVIDTGVDASNPDFKDTDGTSRIIESKAFDGGTAGADDIGHGTHVAGTIAASTNNGDRVAGVAGWPRGGVDVRILNCDANPDGVGGFSADSLTSAINYCVTRGAKVINMSLGGYGGVADIERIAIANAISAGVVVVAAAGNGDGVAGIDHSSQPGFPADLPGVIMVTAVDRSKKLTVYSDYGGVNPQIIASPGGAAISGPADDILSTWPVGGALDGPGNNGTNSIAGTSMACPHVAGAAALLISAGVPASQVYSALAAGAQTPGQALDPRKHGPGVLDVYSALLPFADPDPSIVVVGAQDRGTTFFHQVPITVQIMGVSKIVDSGAVAPQVNVSDVTVEVQAIGRQPAAVKTYVGGHNGAGDFDIPTLGPDDTKGTLFTVTVPRDPANSPRLGPGQYRIVTKINGVETSVQFVKVEDKALPRGRSMVAFPYKAGQITRTTPERGLLGLSPTFTLSRFNPLRSPGQNDYAQYFSNGGITDSLARLVIPGTPLTFEMSDPATSIAPIGLGYWLDLNQAVLIDTTDLTAPGTGGTDSLVSGAVGIRLFGGNGGWNMIGTPFIFPVSWGAVTVLVDGVPHSMADAVQAGVLSPALIGYRNGDYFYTFAPDGIMQPFQGYWVRAYRDCTLVVPPAAIGNAGVGIATRALKSDGWTVRLAALIGGDLDGQNYFGQARNASDGDDRLDVPKPPAGAGHAYVRFVSDSSTGKSRSLAYDLRSNGAGTKAREWTAAVSTDRENAEVTLTWEGVRSVSRNGRLVITDMATGAKRVMNQNPSFTYRSGAAGSTRLFKITLESQSSRGALALTNLRIGSKAAGGWTVRFHSSQDAEVTGRIVTLTGRTIGTFNGPTRAEAMGETTLSWDGHGAEGAPVPAGPYRIEILARTADQQTATIQRVIQVIR